MTKFAPKGEETLRQEIITELGVEYEGNEDVVDKLVARELKDEEFKASLHEDKNKHLNQKKTYEELLVKNGIDPKTGEKVGSKEPEDKTSKNENMSLKDIRALADVHDDDVDDILDFAKWKNMSVAEAKKAPAMIAILKAKEEERRTAQAANAGGGRRGTSQVTDDQILNKFESGQISEDDAEIERLAEARFNQRVARRK